MTRGSGPQAWSQPEQSSIGQRSCLQKAQATVNAVPLMPRSSVGCMGSLISLAGAVKRIPSDAALIVATDEHKLTVSLAEGCSCGEGVGRHARGVSIDDCGQWVVDGLQGGNVVTELGLAACLSRQGRVLRGCRHSAHLDFARGKFRGLASACAMSHTVYVTFYTAKVALHRTNGDAEQAN